ncbi:MAG: hypothetical protein ABI444_14070 [Candidatus Kapaibacterium sp.]|jgi:hypothetical protein
MKKYFFVILFCTLIAGVALAEYTGVIDSLTARTDGDSISLDWHSGVETGVRTYAVERSELNTSSFDQMSTVVATGSYSMYHYKDVHVTSAQAIGQSGNIRPLSDLYKYRLKIVYDNSISYSQSITVSRPSSGVRRTWGMIKEMFH